MTEHLKSTHDIIKAKLGLENSPYKKQIVSQGDLHLNYWFYTEPQQILESKVKTIVFVADVKTNKFPFIELYGFELEIDQIIECTNKFKEKPESFNNQKNV